MEATCKFNSTLTPIPIPLSLRNPRPPFSTPFSSLSFRTPPPPHSLFSIKASSSSSSSSSPSNPLLPELQNPKTPILETLKNRFPTSLLKTTLIAAVTTTALFFAQFNLKPLVAAPISPPPTVENDAVAEEQVVEEYLNSNPNDAEALKLLVELRIKNHKIREAIPLLEQLISLQPYFLGFPLLKSNLHILTREYELAKLGFYDILSKHPLCVEAFHGLVKTAAETESSTELKEIEKRIGEEIEKMKKDKKKKEDLREFKLLLAQIRMIEGVNDDALKIYEELVKEEPRDFRPYICQGLLYTLLSKKDEADKCFQKYRRLVPRGHPYATYFDDNMIKKLFSLKVEIERSDLKSGAQVVENERGASKAEEQVVENERVDSKNEEQLVESESADSKNEEQMVENERADSKNKEQLVGSE